MEGFAEPLSWTLFHSIWQCGAIAVGLWMTLHWIHPQKPQTRYLAACGALLLALIMAVGTFYYLRLPTLASPSSTTPQLASATGEMADSQFRITSELSLSPVVIEDLALTSWVFISWLGGMTFLSIYHLMGWTRTRSLVRTGISPPAIPWNKRLERLKDRTGITKTIRLVESKLVNVPCVIGWLRPVILVPSSAFTGLSVQQLEMILAHELAHIRRHDVLVNYLQTVVETLLFHNPAVWWMSRQVRIEREHCCDDLAANACGNRLLYARALADMEGLRKTDPSFSMAADGGSLVDRVRRLASRSSSPGRKPGVGIMNLVVLIALIGFSMLTLDCHTTRNASAARIVPKAVPQTSPSRDAIQGRWNIEPRREHLQLVMRRDSDGRMSFSIDPDELEGFSAGNNQSFRLVRDAGTFVFQGDVESEAGSYSGSGEWYFEPNAAYVKELEGLDFRIASDEKTMELAIHDVTLDFVHGLDREGYRGFSINKLIELRIHDVTPEYIHELASLGYKDLSLSKLVEMQIHDVEPDFIRAMKDLGYDDLSASKLVEMQIHNVTPEFVGELSKLGYKDLTASKLVELQIHDVEPEYIRALAEMGYKDLRASKLVEMRIHRVTLDYIRELTELGYEGLSPSKLVEMRIHGVKPSYIRELEKVGLKDLTASRLVEMRIHDVDADFVRELQERGFEDLTARRVIELKIHGVH
jgi:beta-lactamase regulating signal transducer with metallopeptidase domain